MFNPDKIYLLFTSLGAKTKSEKDFIEIYEQNSRQLERSEGLIQELGSASSLILIFAILVIIAASFLTCQRTRAFVKETIEAQKKKMIWNGLIIFLEISFIQYCHQFLKIIETHLIDSEKWDQSDKSLVIIRLLLCICIVFVAQSLLFVKLMFTKSEDLLSPEYLDKFGELTKDIKIRENTNFEKFMSSFWSILKAILVLATAFKSDYA